jgi:hypothetical protein
MVILNSFLVQFQVHSSFNSSFNGYCKDYRPANLSWFPFGRAVGGPTFLDMDIQGCQLSRFPLIR